MEDFINLKRIYYKSLEKVFCPYVESDVLLTSSGFKHLIWKSNQVPRRSEDIMERMEALDKLATILSKSGTLQEFEQSDDRVFYCFIAIVEKKKYKVVITKYNINKYKFVSIIPKWKTGKRDN